MISEIERSVGSDVYMNSPDRRRDARIPSVISANTRLLLFIHHAAPIVQAKQNTNNTSSREDAKRTYNNTKLENWYNLVADSKLVFYTKATDHRRRRKRRARKIGCEVAR
jgi:hypothetical protein